MIREAETRVYQHRLLALKLRLEQDRSQLKDEALLPAGGEGGDSLSDVSLHRADLGSHSGEEEVTLGLLKNEEHLLEEVNAALDRVDQGAYGRCESCGKGVSRERLQALPYARHCAPCARNVEQKAR